jgi:hypothetical protein
MDRTLSSPDPNRYLLISSLVYGQNLPQAARAANRSAVVLVLDERHSAPVMSPLATGQTVGSALSTRIADGSGRAGSGGWCHPLERKV